VIVSRRLLLVALLVVAPALAACGSITAADGPSTPPPADSTARYETKPWG
jgi:predicted small lipoprotein YifL